MHVISRQKGENANHDYVLCTARNYKGNTNNAMEKNGYVATHSQFIKIWISNITVRTQTLELLKNHINRKRVTN